MALYEYRACTGYGTVRLNRSICIICPCLYCHGKHPRVKCDNCGELTHKTLYCKRIQPLEIQKGLLPKGQSLHSKKTFDHHERHPQKTHEDSLPQRRYHDTKKTPPLQRFNLSVQCPCHDDPEWSAIPEDIRDVREPPVPK